MEAALAISLLFSLMILGSIFRAYFSSRSWFEKFSKGLISFIYWLLVPLTFIDTFSSRGLSKDLVLPLASSTLLIIIVWVIVKVLKIADEKSIERGVILNSTIQNNLFVGFPVLFSLYGDATMSIYFGFVAFVLVILVPDLMGRGNFYLLAFLKNPVIIGMAIGLFIHYTSPELSSYISTYFFWVPSLLSYLSIFATGLALRMDPEPIKKYKSEVIATTVFKFILNPAVNLLLLSFFSLPHLYRNEVIILSFMPPASLNTVMAMRYNWRPDFVASSSFLLTVVSLPIVLLVYHML
ncbi:MAG: AEC family transporter [Fervidicoccaceae archaeon]